MGIVTHSSDAKHLIHYLRQASLKMCKTLPAPEPPSRGNWSKRKIRMKSMMTAILMLLSGLALAQIQQQTDIPPGSTLYIAPADNNFHIDVAGALRNKGVKLVVVNDEGKADYRMDVTAENKKPGAARAIFLGQWSEGTASATVTNITTGVIVWAYNVHKINRRRQSTAEAIAKHLKDHVK